MRRSHPYLSKHLQYPLQLDEPVEQDLGIVVVVPCYNENNILLLLESLWKCERAEGAVEVIIVINSREEEDQVQMQNQMTFWEAEKWKQRHQDRKLKFFILNFESLPVYKAGAATARKIGMDEAVSRLDLAGNEEGIIVNLDADCTVRNDYLSKIEAYFQDHKGEDIAEIYFEHPLKGEDHPRLYEGIMRIELSMRYHVQGLKYAGIPYARHQLSSSFALRSSCYQLMEGDIFSHFGTFPVKVIDTVVYPAARMSDRQQFGTGAALKNWMQHRMQIVKADHPQSYKMLKALTEVLPKLHKSHSLNELNAVITSLPAPVIAFLSEEDFVEVWQALKSKSIYSDFQDGFFRWFNESKLLQFLHLCRHDYYGEVAVEAGAIRLLQLHKPQLQLNDEAYILLDIYRQLDKGNSIAAILD